MRDSLLLYETENVDINTHLKQDENFRFYQVVVEAIWGLKSFGNIIPGHFEVELWGTLYSTETTDLDLPSQNLSGQIPPEIGKLLNLTRINLDLNELSDPIPVELGQLVKLSSLHLGRNQFRENIPWEILVNLESLSVLYLQWNQFKGDIPPEINNLSLLNTLNLDHNQLSGFISGNICDLTIDWYSNNNFSVDDNKFCPPYPSCIEDYMEDQNTSDCD